MMEDGHKTTVPENALNDNFYRKEFQILWNYITHKYAYTVEFDSQELIEKAIRHINENMYVSRLQYTVTSGMQKEDLDENIIAIGNSFIREKARTQTLEHAETGNIKYDLIGKIAEGTTLTRRTVTEILAGIERPRFECFKPTPEEFITKAIRLIKEQRQP